MIQPGTLTTTPLRAPKIGASLRAGSIFLVLAVIAALFPFLGFTDNPLLLATVVALFACWTIPMWIQYQRGSLDVFETMHLMGLRYFLYFGMGALWIYGDPYHVAYDRYIVPFLNEATFYCFLGYLALMAGYYGPWFRPRRRSTTEEIPTTPLFVFGAGMIGFVGSVAALQWDRASWGGRSLSLAFSTFMQFAPLYYFAFALACLMVFSRTGTRRQRVALLAFFVPATVFIVYNDLADKSKALSLAAVPLIAVWYARRKLPWKTLILLVLVLVFVVFPFFNTFRLLDPYMAVSQRVSMTSEIISHWDSGTYMEHSLQLVKRRLALVNSVSVIVRDTGRWVPYARGETILLPMLTYFVPRVLWPDKQKFTLGRDFGVTFRVVSILDESTSIAVSIPGELYWNFHLPGIIIGMLLIGSLWRLLYRRYGETGGLDPVRRAVHILLLIQIAHAEGGLASQSVVIMRTLIMIEIMCWIGRRAGMLRTRPIPEP